MTHNQAGTEWETKTRKFMSQFILHCDQSGDCEGCKYDMDTIIEYIFSLLRTSQARMVEKLEGRHQEEGPVEGKSTRIEAVISTYKMAYNKGLSDAIAIIKGEDKGV